MTGRNVRRIKVEMLLGISLSVILAASVIPLPASFAATTDCSNIAVKNFKGVVLIDGTLGKSEHETKGTVLTSYITESMKYIRLSGFNAVRVPYYWEAYINDPTTFMAELDLVAKKALDNNICVIYDNHHFYTTSYWKLDVDGKSNGRGFPSMVVKNFPVKNNDYIDTAGPFWNAFLGNSYSVNGVKIWDVQFQFFSKVINKVKGYSSTAGFEILNEPHLFKSSDYDKLGAYNTYMAKKIRSITDKKIFFDRETTRGFPRDPGSELKIFPDGVSGLVYSPHLYSVPNPGSQGEKQIKNIKDWSTQRGTEVLIGEWGSEVKSDAVTFMKAFKANGFGWTAYSWKKSGSAGLGSTLYDSDTTSPTNALQVIMYAMGVVY